MTKITKSNTKEEILEALSEAQGEQEVLHVEVTTLNDKIEKLEVLVQEEDVKKKSLIKELASQSVDIELAEQQTAELDDLASKLGISQAELDSAGTKLESLESELFASNKKVELLTTELAGLKSRALPPKQKKGRFFKPFFKAATVCAVVAVVVVVFNMYYSNPYPMNFTKHENGIVSASYDPNILTLKSENGEVEIGGMISGSISIWAEKAGYDGILYGTVLEQDNGKIVIAAYNDPYDMNTTDVENVTDKFMELGCYNILALVNNPENLDLPFKSTSKGELKFYEGRRKLAGIIPVMWGKDQRVFYIASDNIKGFISTGGIFMDDEITSTAASFDNAEEESPSDK